LLSAELIYATHFGFRRGECGGEVGVMAGGAFEVWPCGDARMNYRLGARVSLTHQIFAMFALLCVLQLHALLNICIKMAFSSACCLVVEIWTYYLCSSTDNLLQS
jgi:hypothetical protein